MAIEVAGTCPTRSGAILPDGRENWYHRPIIDRFNVENGIARFHGLKACPRQFGVSPMPADGSITRWIAELELGRAGDAQEELWRRYFHRLIGLAKLKLGETPRTAADEEDVAAAALHSFFAGVAQQRFPALHDRNDVWPLLAKITAHKALDQQRYLLAAKRGGGHVRGDSAMTGPSDSQAPWPNALLDEELGPDYLAALSEQCGRLMASLPDDQLRLITRRRLEGYTNAEIAKEVGVIERTVERRIQLVRSLWSEELRKDVAR
jgi:DNA-directed RNA polymerase specialized sigma24 family protein